MEGFSDDLLIKNNKADMIVNATIVDFDDAEKCITLLFDSNDNWSSAVGDSSLLSALGFFGASIMNMIADDAKAKYVLIEYFQIVNGVSQNNSLPKMRPFIKDGKRYKRARVLKINGKIELLPEDEF